MIYKADTDSGKEETADIYTKTNRRKVTEERKSNSYMSYRLNKGFDKIRSYYVWKCMYEQRGVESKMITIIKAL